MFGYVVVNRDELKIKEYRTYRSYYCGLCHALRERHGIRGQMTLNFDMVFLALLLCGLYEPHSTRMRQRCIAHPLEKHEIRSNEVLDYVADMNILLAYHNLRDDWQDDRNVVKKVSSDLLRGRYRQTAAQYPEQVTGIVEYLRKLHRVERADSGNLDEAAGLTGEMMGTLFAYRHDEWEDSLRTIGFYLGKFIYLMDAYDDLEKDAKKGRYNALSQLAEQLLEREFEQRCQEYLTQQMGLCAQNFELLPVLKATPEGEILYNTIYSGVWSKYALVKTHREGKNHD